MQSTDMVIVTKLESAININERHSQWIHQKYKISRQYMSEYGQNIADESQFLTSTSNMYCFYFRLDR
jgi:predicted DNA-binding helix-hairpin-helix protein